MIDPHALAFDIDGVVADTMTLFLNIAHEDYQLHHLRLEDITSYNLLECLEIEVDVLEIIVDRLLEGDYRQELRALPGADRVLTRLGHGHPPLCFVTARPHAGPVFNWMQAKLPTLPADVIDIVPTGSFERKADILKARGIRYFVEDRLETCFQLQTHDITPIVFRQPWNRQKHPFSEVGSWDELEQLIVF